LARIGPGLGFGQPSLLHIHLYSDHDHQLILVVDEVAKARAVAAEWTRERA